MYRDGVGCVMATERLTCSDLDRLLEVLPVGINVEIMTPTHFLKGFSTALKDAVRDLHRRRP
ncbi:hypothetical protein BGW80DRAFT_1265287 [Lactifluus volemus]|nr:hypothetical protein BGW80DRAFT_1265287 [Lactifluus volemus]